jgi:hypothetical protein
MIGQPAFDCLRRVGPVALGFLVFLGVRVFGQAVDVRVVGDAMHVQAPAFDFIKGEALARLKDGRSLGFDFELAVLSKTGAPAAIRSRQRFVLSYDLWEERFAVTRTGTPPRSISHLSAADAEAWCLQQLTVPTSGLGRLGRDAPLWIRLEYRVELPGGSPSSDDDGGFTLRGLIDRLSRRPKADELRDSIEAGPFQLGIQN